MIQFDVEAAPNAALPVSDKLVDEVLEEFLAAAFVLGFAAFEDVFFEGFEIGLAGLDVCADAGAASGMNRFSPEFFNCNKRRRIP